MSSTRSPERCSSIASCIRRCAIPRIMGSCRTPSRPTGSDRRAGGCPLAVHSGSVVRSRPIAVLFLEDEHGGDEKLLTVPVDTTFPYYSDVGEAEGLPDIVRPHAGH